MGRRRRRQLGCEGNFERRRLRESCKGGGAQHNFCSLKTLALFDTPPPPSFLEICETERALLAVRCLQHNKPPYTQMRHDIHNQDDEIQPSKRSHVIIP